MGKEQTQYKLGKEGSKPAPKAKEPKVKHAHAGFEGLAAKKKTRFSKVFHTVSEESAKKNKSKKKNKLAKKKTKISSYDDYVSAVDDKAALFDFQESQGFWSGVAENTRNIYGVGKKILEKQYPIVIKKLQQGGAWLKLKAQFDVAKSRTNITKTKKKKLATARQNNKGLNKHRLFNGKTLLMVATTISVVVFSSTLFTNFLSSNNGSENGEGEVAGASSADNVQGTTRPETFPTLGSETVKPEQGLVFDPARGVATFRDTVGGYTITVSQQPLSEEQQLDPGVIAEQAAVSLLAEGSFTSKKGKAYYTTPSSEGDQSQVVIFTHKGLLIFLRTQGVQLDAALWETYIDSLQ